ncbi:small ubiquitin-related modifier [Fistulifera solaris]|uniref:Small ubiquitin-related modifier n=1 Tax=Fistulifera solaris TaxID=1519565 RepID=A0A1Z5JHQ4_FISSO|nr:small ubiquitin-related modifier [Fistulifera solaris]GAX28316.1 small ubiquitin-related modifier [Fistulifera solaris]|eukprot:GAX13529.1 small ubiquitin-related modifier [Fistulifera solaris]
MSGDDEPNPDALTIRIRDQQGEETFFKIKKTTKMQKVFETYATRKGLQIASLRFLLDGERVEPTSTPKMLELEDQDQIDCMLEQAGGFM